MIFVEKLNIGVVMMIVTLIAFPPALHCYVCSVPTEDEDGSVDVITMHHSHSDTVLFSLLTV